MVVKLVGFSMSMDFELPHEIYRIPKYLVFLKKSQTESLLGAMKIATTNIADHLINNELDIDIFVHKGCCC